MKHFWLCLVFLVLLSGFALAAPGDNATTPFDNSGGLTFDEYIEVLHGFCGIVTGGFFNYILLKYI